jgi:hypothetical protein
MDDEDAWVEKPSTGVSASNSTPAALASSSNAMPASATSGVGLNSVSTPGGGDRSSKQLGDDRMDEDNDDDNDDYDDEDDDNDGEDDFGPQPLYPAGGGGSSKRRTDERQYGGALLRGEGSAMAAFLQGEDGSEARIPRRGEIGLTSDQIEQYEHVGYVMSGSRHRRMNAVRIRKENQVISAEEKRGILKLQKEERERREAILREEFSSLVEDKLKKETSKKV